MPGYANPQALNRYSYVLGNPLKYIDPSGHNASICLDGVQCYDGGSTLPILTGGPTPPNNDDDGDDDIVLNGVPDIVIITLTPDELIQISNNINDDLAAPDGLIEQADNDATTITTVYAITSGITVTSLCSTLIACPAALTLGITLTSDLTVNYIANELTQAQYEDLQTVSTYFGNAGNDALENSNSGLTVVVFNGADGGTYIALEGQENMATILSGPYYYNYTIVPYIQPFVP